MKNMIIAVAVIMALFIGVMIYSSVANKPEPEPEPEPPCENTVNIAGVDYKIDVTTSLSLNSVDLTVEDMRQLPRLVNLTHLELKSCEISDISALSRMTGLVRLDLRFNNITDLSSLERLENLTYLNLSHNRIVSVEPLYAMTNLTELELGANFISDLSPLYGRLPALKNLYIYDNAKDGRGIDVFNELEQGEFLRGRFPGATIHF
ncbi:MAG: leucine-rich repeat domain-containing protein [Oscillospiraceae bacterium]|nr:leucine-rich repeat domain-containing protein [Oscillospiraceae bacterium]